MDQIFVVSRNALYGSSIDASRQVFVAFPPLKAIQRLWQKGDVDVCALPLTIAFAICRPSATA